MIVYDGDGSQVYVHDGQGYRLLIERTAPLLRSSFRLVSDVVGDLPPSEYVSKSYRNLLDVNQYTLDQKSHGSCVGFSTAGACMKLRFAMGQTLQRLSGAFVYSFINGGRDNGASIGDALSVARDKGVCLESEAPWDAIYPNRYPASAKLTAGRFVAEEIYRVDTWAQACTASQMGFAIVYAVMVGGSFDRLDSDGVVGLDRGPGNHAVHAFGMVKGSRGDWLLEGYNSWGTTWGQQGRFRSGQRHWESVEQDAFAFRSVRWDPQDPNQPPMAR